MSSLRAQRALQKYADGPLDWVKENILGISPTPSVESSRRYIPMRNDGRWFTPRRHPNYPLDPGNVANDVDENTARIIRGLHGVNPNDTSARVVYDSATDDFKIEWRYTPMEPLESHPIFDYERASDEELERHLQEMGKHFNDSQWYKDEHERARKEKLNRAEKRKAAKRERDRQHIQQLRKETIRSIRAAQEANSPSGIARMTAQELGNNLLDIGNKALETGKNIGKKTLEVGSKAAKEGGKAALNWINAQADATRTNAETRREIARAKNKAIEEQTAAIKAAQAAQAAKEAQVSQYLGYAPWLLGGGLAGAGLGSAIGSQYKNTLLGAILGGAGGVGLGGLGKYVYDKYVSKQASADVDYSGVERRAKFRAMLG